MSYRSFVYRLFVRLRSDKRQSTPTTMKSVFLQLFPAFKNWQFRFLWRSHSWLIEWIHSLANWRHVVCWCHIFRLLQISWIPDWARCQKSTWYQVLQSNGNGNLIIIIAAVRTHEVRQTSDRRIKQESVIGYVDGFSMRMCRLCAWVHLFLCNICCFLCLFICACMCLFLLHCECVCVWLCMGGQADAAEPTAAWRAVEAGYTHSCTHTLYTRAQLCIYYSCTNCSQIWRSDIKVTRNDTLSMCRYVEG